MTTLRAWPVIGTMSDNPVLESVVKLTTLEGVLQEWVQQDAEQLRG